ncbi:MAG TPA: transposase [Clostridia bacterium]|nr:transposase [Clostridia bacterium]
MLMRMLDFTEYHYRRRLPHMQGRGGAVMITFATLGRAVLCPESRDVVLRQCLWGNGKRYELHAAVIMPEHVHLLLTPAILEDGSACPVRRIMQGIKSVSAHQINAMLKRRGPVWQAESYDHVLRSGDALVSAARYLAENPVRRGIVSDSSQYAWCWIRDDLGLT